MQIDLKGWALNYSPSFQYHSLLQILNCVAGIEILFFLIIIFRTEEQINFFKDDHSVFFVPPIHSGNFGSNLHSP
jgi:hypothetical protein